MLNIEVMIGYLFVIPWKRAATAASRLSGIKVGHGLLVPHHVPKVFECFCSGVATLQAIHQPGQAVTVRSSSHRVSLFPTMIDANASAGWAHYQQQFLPVIKTFCALSLLAFILVGLLAFLEQSRKLNAIVNFGKFFYASFLKPHSGDDAATGQQSALESFYRAQVGFLLSIM